MARIGSRGALLSVSSVSSVVLISGLTIEFRASHVVQAVFERVVLSGRERLRAVTGSVEETHERPR